MKYIITYQIDSDRYRERLQAVSKALRDQMESPNDRALWWIEYAIRHKDAPHMHYAGKYLPTDIPNTLIEVKNISFQNIGRSIFSLEILLFNICLYLLPKIVIKTNVLLSILS